MTSSFQVRKRILSREVGFQQKIIGLEDVFNTSSA